jgi:putative NADH-flavin reductase
MERSNNLTILNVVVLGANGGIGRHAVSLALSAGHLVTAILRTPGNLKITHPNLKIIQGDVMRPETLEGYLKNQDVVISAIGKNSLKRTTLYSQGNRNLIDVMKRAGTNRVFFISASGLQVNPTHSLLVRFVTRFILQTLLRNMYSDLWLMEKIVKETNLNWTIVRPPKLLDHPGTGIYRVSINSHVNNGLKISRADVAHYMVNNLTNDAIFKKTVEVAY